MLLALALVGIVLVARATWEADWLYLVALALLGVAFVFRLKWEWQGTSRREAALFFGALLAVMVVAFLWETIFG